MDIRATHTLKEVALVNGNLPAFAEEAEIFIRMSAGCIAANEDRVFGDPQPKEYVYAPATAYEVATLAVELMKAQQLEAIAMQLNELYLHMVKHDKI